MNITRRTTLKGAVALGLFPFLPRSILAHSTPMTDITLVGSAGSARPDLGFMFLGIPAGFYRDIGINGDFMTISGSAAAMQLVTSGEAQFAHVSMLELIKAKANNPNLPIKAIYLQDWGSGYEIIVPEDSPIQSLNDLSGKTLGVLSLASGAVEFSKAMLRNSGVDPDTVEKLPVGGGAQALAALRTGEVQALSLFRGSHAALENAGMRFRYFTVPVPSSVLAVNAHFLRENPDAVTAVLQGVVLNSVYMKANPEGAVHYFWELLGKPAGDENELLQKGAHIINQMADLWRPEGEMWGDMNDQTWMTLIDFLGDTELSNIDLTSLYSNELIPAVNEVDISIALNKADEDRVD